MNKYKLRSICKKISDETGLSYNVIQTHYFLETILEKKSKSDENQNFIFKGGFLLASFIGIKQRSTVDIDFLIRKFTLTKENISQKLEKILKHEVYEDINYEIKKVEEIRKDDEYGGFRIAIECKLDNIRQIILLDIATGDPITPKEIIYKYKSTFDDKIYEIYSYNIETILAEKIQTIYQRGVFNTRSKDFYDVYILFHLKKKEIDYEKLGVACRNTFKHRSNKFNVVDILNVLGTLKGENDMLKYWSNYQDRFRYAKNISFHEVIDTIAELMMNLIEYD